MDALNRLRNMGAQRAANGVMHGKFRLLRWAALFALGTAELAGYNLDLVALPLGLLLFVLVFTLRLWSRNAVAPVNQLQP